MADLKVFQDLLKQNSEHDDDTIEKGPIQPPPLDPVIHVPPDEEIPHSEQCCGNCSAFRQLPNTAWACMAIPPIPIFLGFQTTKTLIGGKPQQFPLIPAVYPPVEAHNWCRCWERNKEG